VDYQQPPAQVETQKTGAQKQAPQKKPDVHQESHGSNSPNISMGDHGTVNINQAQPARSPRFREKVEMVRFVMGGMKAGDSVSTLRTRHVTPFRFGDAVPFEMYMEGDTVYVDVRVGDGSRSSPFVTIKHNEFVQPPVGWDRNFDDSALEFVNQNGLPMFQLIYAGPSIVQVTGIFVVDKFLIIANETSMAINPGPGFYHLPEPIFKYPSHLHARERIRR
jgi:hypothetical protein